MHGNLLGLPACAVRLRMVFRTRSSDRVQRPLQHIMLERLQNEQRPNRMCDRILDHVLCFDQMSFTKSVGVPLVMTVRNDQWFPTFVIRYCCASLKMRGREVTSSSAFFPAYSSCNQTHQEEKSRYCWALEYRPSMRNFDHDVFEELGVRNGS